MSALRYYPETINRSGFEDWNLFVTLTDVAFEVCDGFRDFVLLSELLRSAREAALRAAQDGRGHYVQPWIPTLLWKARDGPASRSLPWDSMMALVDALEGTLSRHPGMDSDAALPVRVTRLGSSIPDDVFGREDEQSMAESIQQLRTLYREREPEAPQAVGRLPLDRPLPQGSQSPATTDMPADVITSLRKLRLLTVMHGSSG